MIPDLRHARIGADDETVLLTAHSFAVAGRELDFAAGCLGVVVKRLRPGVINRRPTRAIEERAGSQHMEALRESRALLAVVVVRADLGGGRIETGNLENGLHPFFQIHLGRAGWKYTARRGVEPADFIAQDGPARKRREGAGPPVGDVRAVWISMRGVGHPDRLGGAFRNPAGAFWGAAIRGEIEPHLIDLELIAGLHLDGDGRAARCLRGG